MKSKILKRTITLAASMALSLSIIMVLPVTAKAGEVKGTYANEEEEEVYEGTVTIAAPDVINNVDTFNVYGTVSCQDGPVPVNCHMFLEIVNRDENKPYIHEIQLVENVSNGEYIFSSVKIPSGYADDTYLIRVYLWGDDEDILLGMNEKEVLLINQ